MKTLSIFRPAAIVAILAAVATGCQKGDLTTNYNVANQDAVGISPSLFLNHASVALYKGGGVLESVAGNIPEEPWGLMSHYNQFCVSNYAYYQGVNTYNWSNSATQYDLLKYITLMEKQAAAQNPLAATFNVYYGLGKFYRAYSFIWMAERVGDIPMSQTNNINILHPGYDSQKSVYVSCLQMLDSANLIIGNLIAKNGTPNAVVDAAGDIYGLTYLQWQKLINTYKLRVLISLSKRADDNTDMAIKSQFADIINNPTTRPIMTGNTDNMIFKYNGTNTYPVASNPNYGNISLCKTYVNLITSVKDPRTFKVASPVGGKPYADFASYIGADINTNITSIDKLAFSYGNYNYFSKNNLNGSLVESEILIGYPELCFNIAEAASRGWITGGDATATTWYNKGVDASLSLYNLTDGQSYTVTDGGGNTLGPVTIDVTTFKTNIAFKGGTDGLKQILEQKYVAFFQNSGWEAFYNFRRTGFPAFSQGGEGIGTANNLIPRRWQYPQNEKSENAANCSKAIQDQFQGADDVSKDTWLTK